MQTRTIGNQTVGTFDVGAIGMGTMTFDQTGHQPREQLADTVRAALDAGVTLFDTADAYGPGELLGPDTQGENEKLVTSLLDELGVRDQVHLATKGGCLRSDGGSWYQNSDPAYLHSAVDASLGRLGVEQIWLWQHHRPEPNRDYNETIGVLKEIADTGKVRMIGLSNVNPEQITAAHEVLGDHLVSVQNQFSPKFRSSLPELQLCAQLGIAFLPWSPLGGLGDAKELAEKHPAFAGVAQARGVSPQQVALAWQLAQADVVIPIPGAKRPQSISDSAAAADLELSPEELRALDEA